MYGRKPLQVPNVQTSESIQGPQEGAGQLWIHEREECLQFQAIECGGHLLYSGCCGGRRLGQQDHLNGPLQTPAQGCLSHWARELGGERPAWRGTWLVYPCPDTAWRTLLVVERDRNPPAIFRLDSPVVLGEALLSCPVA